MDLKSPTLLLNEEQCRNNIEKISKAVYAGGTRLVPHFKTHQSATIGRWFREYDIDTITVSSVKMARYFADHGWNKITIAFPANRLESETIDELAIEVDLSIVVNDPDTANYLDQNLHEVAGVIIEVDTGYHRTGIPYNEPEKFDQLIEVLDQSQHLEFEGFYAHPGHSYGCRSASEIRGVYQDTVNKLAAVRDRYASRSEKPAISLGDTPTASTVGDFSEVDAVRPGNFVFYDLMQAAIGSCSIGEIAVALACPVVEKNAARRELVVHAGSVHLSKEHLVVGKGEKIYGRPVSLQDDGWSAPWDDSYMTKLSQEHGTIRCDEKAFNKVRVGDIIGILPVHSCLTANLMKGYRSLAGPWIDHLEGSRSQ